MAKKKPSAATEQHAAENLLQRGVKIKIAAPRFIRWAKKTISLKVGSPYQGTLLRISSYYCGMGIQDNKLENLTVEEALLLMKVHGVALSKAVACAVLNGYWSGRLFTKVRT